MPPKAKLHKDKGKLKVIPKVVANNDRNNLESEPGTSSSNETQFQVELVWCIQQLQTALSAGKLNPKQTQDTTKTLNSLMNNSTPVIKKRQLMRLAFGDYRAKMAQEEEKYRKINQKLMVQPGKPSKKSVFIKKAPFLVSGKDFKFDFAIKDNLDTSTEQIKNLNISNSPDNQPETSESKSFHFEPSNNVFRFNFVPETNE